MGRIKGSRIVGRKSRSGMIKRELPYIQARILVSGLLRELDGLELRDDDKGYYEAQLDNVASRDTQCYASYFDRKGHRR